MKYFTILLVLFLSSPLAYGQDNLIASKDTAWFEAGDLFNAFQEKVLRIHPSLDTYRVTFSVNQLPEPEEKIGRISSYTLKIFIGDAGKPIQVMKDTVNGANFFIGNNYDYENEFPDINFDGYTDLPITVQSYPLGDRSYDFWLFDKHSKKFKKGQFNNLVNPLIYSDKKEFSTTAVYSCSGFRCGETKYFVVAKNKPKLVRKETTDLERIDTTYFHISTYEKLINGKMKVVQTDTSKIKR